MRVDRKYPEDLPQNERFLVTLRGFNNQVPYALSINTRGVPADEIHVAWSEETKTVVFYSTTYDQAESRCLTATMICDSVEDLSRIRASSIARAVYRNPDTGNERLYIMFIREGE